MAFSRYCYIPFLFPQFCVVGPLFWSAFSAPLNFHSPVICSCFHCFHCCLIWSHSYSCLLPWLLLFVSMTTNHLHLLLVIPLLSSVFKPQCFPMFFCQVLSCMVILLVSFILVFSLPWCSAPCVFICVCINKYYCNWILLSCIFKAHLHNNYRPCRPFLALYWWQQTLTLTSNFVKLRGEKLFFFSLWIVHSQCC